MTPSEMQAEIARLSEENAFLRSENERVELEDFRDVFLPEVLDTYRPQARVAVLLWSGEGRTFSYRTIMDHVELRGVTGKISLSVYISQLRKALGDRAVIRTVREVGYAMTLTGLQKMAALRARHKADYHA